MIEPFFFSTIALAKTIVGRTVPKRLRSTTLRTASTSRSKIVFSGGTVAAAMFPPAAFRRMSIPPNFSTISLQLASRVSLSSTFVGMKQASPPSATISATIASPFSAARSRSRRATLAPWAAKYFTMVAPRTPQAPVITTTFPLMSKRLSIIFSYLTGIDLITLVFISRSFFSSILTTLRS